MSRDLQVIKATYADSETAGRISPDQWPSSARLPSKKITEQYKDPINIIEIPW